MNATILTYSNKNELFGTLYIIYIVNSIAHETRKNSFFNS